MVNETPHRFIAGAVCPRCKALDKLVMYRLGEATVQECVQCGFTDRMRFVNDVALPETRVTREPAQVLRLVGGDKSAE